MRRMAAEPVIAPRSLDRSTTRDLFPQLISRRYQRGPKILSSNQNFASWADVFGGRVIVAATLDRLLYYALTVSLPAVLLTERETQIRPRKG
jgi:DNA replication protein DnaC